MTFEEAQGQRQGAEVMKRALLLGVLLIGCGGSPFEGVGSPDPVPSDLGAAPGLPPDGLSAPDAGKPDPVAPDAAQGDVVASDAAPPVEPDASPSPDAASACDVIVQWAHAHGIECGMYEGCDVGGCTGDLACGGSGTDGKCGDACLSQDSLVEICDANNVFGSTQAQWALTTKGACKDVYTIRPASTPPIVWRGSLTGGVQDPKGLSEWCWR